MQRVCFLEPSCGRKRRSATRATVKQRPCKSAVGSPRMKVFKQPQHSGSPKSECGSVVPTISSSSTLSVHRLTWNLKATPLFSMAVQHWPEDHDYAGIHIPIGCE